MTEIYKFDTELTCCPTQVRSVQPIVVEESRAFVSEFVAAMNSGQIPLLMHPQTPGQEREKILNKIAELDPRFLQGNYFIMCTSGTTGYTKLVVHNYDNALATGQQYANVLQACEKDVFFSAAKMFHAYGLGNSFSIPQAAKASVVYCDQLITPQLARDIIDTHGVTVFCGVPRHYHSMVQTQSYPCGRSLRICVSAGEKLPEPIKKEFEKHTGVKIIDAVGSTELLGFMLSNGIPVPGVDVKLDRNELLAKSSSMFLGYYNEPAHNIENNWVRTGDLYELHNGLYIHQGRVNDLIKINGTKVYTGAVEQEIRALPGVHECCLIKYNNAQGLEKLKLFLVCDNYNGLRSHIADISKKYRISFLTEIKDVLPRTTTGKIRKYLCV